MAEFAPLPSVAEFVEAYRVSGLTPLRRDYGDGSRCGCPLTALCRARHPSSPVYGRDIADFACVRFGQRKVIAFVAGVDGHQPAGKEPDWASHAHGCAVWAAVSKEFGGE